MQFSAIYVLLSVPCVYIISPSGKAVDVKLGNVDAPELREWIVRNTAYSQIASSSNDLPSTPSPVPPPTESTQAVVEENAQPTKSIAPLEERVNRAYQIVEEKRQQRTEEEKEKARAAEVQRREVGKAMQDYRERQRARDVQEAMAERRRDEVEARQLRERLKRQIEDDRRAFQERNQDVTTTPTVTPPSESIQVQQSRQYDTTRLQLRLVGGGHVIGLFEPTATLASEVRDWLQQEASSGESLTDAVRETLSTLVTKGYRFRQLHPAKLFEPEEETKSLTDLGLCPSAVLMLVSSSGRTSAISVQPAFGAGWSNGMYGAASSLFGTAYSYASWLLGGLYSLGSGFVSSLSPNQRTRAAAGQPPSAAATGGPSSPRGSQENRAIRRQGNMARLSHRPDDSDDEQARWNGNSTEQM